MKTIGLILLLIIIQIEVNGQVPLARYESCDKTEIELKIGQKFPEGYVIMGISQVKLGEVITDLDDLTSKQRKEIQQIGKMFKCCYVFVDINDVIKSNEEKGVIWVYAMRKLEYVYGENMKTKE